MRLLHNFWNASLMWIVHMMSEWLVNSVAGESERLIGGSIVKPFVILCRQSFIPWKFFFFNSYLAQSLHHFTLWVTHTLVNHASDLLKNWCLAFSVIKADLLPYSSDSPHFAVGSQRCRTPATFLMHVTFLVLPYIMAAVGFASDIHEGTGDTTSTIRKRQGSEGKC